MEKSLEEMSGERTGSPKLKLNQIGMNGKTGKFVFRDILGGLKEDEKGKKYYEETEIGDEATVVFLKIRRRLYAFRKKMKALSTQEHTSKADFLVLYGNDKIERGTNDELRAKYDKLKTQQIVYAIYNGELVRVTVKGSALGSENKAKDVPTFYDYITSFKKDGRNDHFYNYETILYSVQEEGDQGEYMSMSFKQGKKLDEKQMEDVKKFMKIAFNFCEESDAYYAKTYGSPTASVVEEEVEEPEIQAGGGDELKDDINPDDIPF